MNKPQLFFAPEVGEGLRQGDGKGLHVDNSAVLLAPPRLLPHTLPMA